MTDVAKNCVYVALGAVVLCCLWVIGGVMTITFWYPERVIPKETWTLAQGASQILLTLVTGLIIGVLVKQSPK